MRLRIKTTTSGFSYTSDQITPEEGYTDEDVYEWLEERLERLAVLEHISMHIDGEKKFFNPLVIEWAQVID